MHKQTMTALLTLLVTTTMGCAAPEDSPVAPEAAKTADAPLTWLTDFAAAKKLATEKELPILADFSGSDWCGWCIKLDKEVFSQKPFKEYATTNVVLFLADFPRKELPPQVKEQNEALAKQYGIRGFPTVLLLDATGKVLARTGYQRGGPEAYVEHLKKLLADAATASAEAE